MHVSEMEPVLPPADGKFISVAAGLHREAAALRSTAHPTTRAALAELVRVVNSFYSNLIEGIRTTPAEIQAAIKADYSKDPGRAAVQKLALAHIRVEKAITAELRAHPEMEVTTADFLKRLHNDLYEDVPLSERIVCSPSGREVTLTPGDLRHEDVTVGEHRPPPFADVPVFLQRFHEAYRPSAHDDVTQVIAFAASHHRLAWIHPFLDGNGRVSRLMTTAYARKIDLDAGGLWSIARGFARYQKEYYARLAAADAERRNQFDGRGVLSLTALEEWCDFVIRTALDQITYMRSLLAPETLADRLRGYVGYRVAGGTSVGPTDRDRPWRTEAGDLLADLVSRGSLTRAQAFKYLPGGERTSREALSTLLNDGVLASDSHRADVRLAFPAHVAQIVFPDLMALPLRDDLAPAAPASDVLSVRASLPTRTSPPRG